MTKRQRGRSRLMRGTAGLIVAFLMVGCAGYATRPGERHTRRDRTYKGAGIGAAIGAAAAVADGKREADEILAGAAIGAVVGGGVGAYMDRLQERLAHIPGTRVERVSEDTLLIHFESDILFAVDSATLSGSSLASLDQSAAVIHEYDKTAVVVQGHTDSTGSETHNQALSERRATSVHNYLIGRGVDAARMTAVGYGEGMPVASNDTESGRQLNRRVNVLLKAKAR